MGRTETRGSRSLPRFAIQFVAGVAEARPGEWERERAASLASNRQSAKCQQGQPSHLEISVNVELICNSAFKKRSSEPKSRMQIVIPEVYENIRRTRTHSGSLRLFSLAPPPPPCKNVQIAAQVEISTLYLFTIWLCWRVVWTTSAL